jgi:hypothetical protein
MPGNVTPCFLVAISIWILDPQQNQKSETDIDS